MQSACRDIRLRASLAVILVSVTGLLGAHVVLSQERDLDPPHDPSNSIDCMSCHVPFGTVPLPIPPDWITNNVCRSCHIEGGVAAEMSPHLAGGATVAWCTDCHNPHQHQEAYRHDYIRRSITTPNSGQRDLAWRFAGDFLHGDTGVTQPYDGVCETCHTQTDYHRNNAGGDHSHNSAMNCTSCHSHSSGFQGTCDSCHGAPPATGAHLAHFTLSAGSASYGQTDVDNLSTPSGYAFACGVCHPYDPAQHNNGVVNVELHNANAAAGSMKALSPAGATYVPGGTIHFDDHGIQYTLGSCSSVYCHSNLAKSSPGPISNPIMSNGLPVLDANGNLTYDPYTVTYSQAYTTVGWGGPSLACNGCHQSVPRTNLPGVDAGTADSHSWIDPYGYDNLHAWNMGFDPISCRTCHYSTVTTAPPVPRDGMGVAIYPDLPIADKRFHINGQRDVVFDHLNPVIYPASGGTRTYSLAASTWNEGSRTCSTVPCHKSQPQPEWGKPYRWYAGTYECDQCHRYASWPTREDHPDMQGRGCLDCHPDTHGNNRRPLDMLRSLPGMAR